ncbi:MAG TPA: HAD-IB family phosphatase [Candidatus Paceibacterota bacterium]|nr:HAD-IB family phosphatase [Candidatus Paceibacterota bacterium]
MTQKRKVAVFDVDGTIFRSSLLIQVVDQLIRDGVFPEESQALFSRQHEKWLDREGDYDAYIQGVVQAFMQYMIGVHYGDLADAARKVVAAQWKHTYRYPRNLISLLKERGYFLLAVSHSPKTILDKFCPKLGFDKSYGSLYEIDVEEKFTGRQLERETWENKANVVRRAIDVESLMLRGSIGVGDTESDISFLEIVQKPICFNPNKKLYDHAKKHGWKVVVERKDVIYEL